jgi:hypothetical protein
MEKYNQTSERWGEYSFAGHKIGMTPNIARNKAARISYIMGHLAKKGDSDTLDRMEARREKHELPLRPFNAGWRNAHRKGLGEFVESQPTRGKDPRYREVVEEPDCFEIMQGTYAFTDSQWNEDGEYTGF